MNKSNNDNKFDSNSEMFNGSAEYEQGKGGKLLFVYQEDIEKFEKILDEYAYMKIKIRRLEDENNILKNGIIKIKNLVIGRNNKYM